MIRNNPMMGAIVPEPGMISLVDWRNVVPYIGNALLTAGCSSFANFGNSTFHVEIHDVKELQHVERLIRAANLPPERVSIAHTLSSTSDWQRLEEFETRVLGRDKSCSRGCGGIMERPY